MKWYIKILQKKKNIFQKINLIIKYFKITGISCLMDRSEDNRFDGFDLINELTDLNFDEFSSSILYEINNDGKNEMNKIDEEGGEFEIEEIDDSEEAH